jgi:hypothetical protein
MTKPYTLENVLLKTRSARQNKLRSNLPSRDNLNMLLQYSMALEVKKTTTAGTCFLILN